MADAADLDNLSARAGNSRVDGVKFGETVLWKQKRQRRAKAQKVFMMRKSYSEKQLVEALQCSTSIRQVLQKLGLAKTNLASPFGYISLQRARLA